MTLEQLQGELSEYITRHPDEADDPIQVRDWVREYGQFAFVKDNLEGHLTGSMLIINQERTKVLLMLHKKFQRWQQFGGHCDGEIDVRNVAIREFHEESGIEVSPEVREGIFHVAVHDIAFDAKGRPPHRHFDLLYLGILPEDVPMSHQESEVDGIGWFPFDEAKKLNQEALMQTMLDKIQAL